ncbi:uncharacterized protein Pyn_06708 [Prunus yedoensis var. nudiflora]|uniref:SAP domain-containing protein n=1 Tax=Prunus yedoensis var. nudiflora TaxID=2094558 RepID=A0A315ASX4_PRUYE|nr:uncharacterized protein Pyn_06708 [Prunus yedoensis var. nudiflora]
MEGSSSQPSDSNQTASGAFKFLQNLPSRGLLSSTFLSSNPGGMRVYVCVRDTSPPEDQHIQTNQQNILIRSLTLKKQKGDSSSKDVKGAGAAEGSRKVSFTCYLLSFRVAERVLDSRTSAKRAASQSSSRQEGSSSSQASSRDFQGLTVERLRALLKAKGLSSKGKKDELIARLKSSS